MRFGGVPTIRTRVGEVGTCDIGALSLQAIPHLRDICTSSTRDGVPPCLEGVPLFLPVVAVVVVAVPLPEARLVRAQELAAAEPLRALPEVAVRDDEPERPAVLRRQ